MNITSLGDLAQIHLLRRQNADLKSEVTRLSTEVTTGQTANVGQHLAGDVSALAGIDSALARLGSFTRAANEAAFFTGAMQTALSAVQDMATGLAPAFLSTATAGNAGSVLAAAHEGRQSFETAVSLYNTRLGDRAIFGGVETARAPLADPDVLLSAMEAAVAGAVSAADVEAALDGWFASPTGFAATGYLGGQALAGLPVAPGQSATIDVTAADPAVKETLKAFGMAALVDRGLFAGAPQAQAGLLRRAGERLLEGQNSLALLGGRLGTIEGQIETARVRNGAETTALQIARAELLSVDPYEAATRLQAAQGQLESLYAITARLSRLNLVDFLR
jgi:flagellar hook-associated protein 3 FlgL